MNNTIKTLFVSLGLVIMQGLYADIVVKGVVKDGASDNEPLMGATVKVVDSNAGTITDMDGAFELTVADDKQMIEVSYIGYASQRLTVSNQMVIVLQEDVAMMDEVVVVGYGTMKKSDLSGAITHVTSAELKKGGVNDVAQSLQGKIAGVDVRISDAAPGAGTSITVRGANSFYTTTQPLYIVDGVPYGTDPNGMPNSGATEGANQQTNPLSFINPNDIESIEVLKDASATAIYGSRGANGVVMITTKKGKQSTEKKPTVEVNMKWGVQQVAKQIDMLDAYTYALYQNEATTNYNLYEGDTRELPYRGVWEYPYIGSGFVYDQGKYNPSPEDFLHPGLRTDEYGNVDEVAPTNWQKQIFQLGWTQEYNVSVSNGSERGWYNISLNYSDQQGIVKNTGNQRYGVTANLGLHITKWLEIGTSQFFTVNNTDFQRTNSENTGIIRSALIFPPTYGVHTQTEQLDELNWLATNPVNYVNGATDKLKQMSWWSSNYLEIKFLPWLKFRQNLGMGYNDGHRSTYYDRHTQEGKTPNNGKAGKATNVWKSITTESLLSFNKTIGIHQVDAVLGATFEGGWGESSSMTATNFASDATKASDMSLALDRPIITSSETTQKLVSFLARANYSLLSRYLFTFSVRTDGSSAFTTNNKWATFLSGAFAWRMSEEPWMKRVKSISNWKWRISCGQTGNQGIGAYRTLMALQAANYPYNGTLANGYSAIDWRGPNNPDLKWETTTQVDAGLDLGFINNRFTFVLDYYYKRTTDLLQNVTLPPSAGYEQMLVNNGCVTNQGFEATIGLDVLQQRNWRWNIQANVSLNRNKISGLSGDQYARSLWSAADQVFIQRNGHAIGTLYGYMEDGLDDKGEIKYRDLNGDGSITEADRTIIGNTNPKFVGSLASTLSWKTLSLSFMFYGSYGNDIFNYNLTDIQMSNVGNITREAYNNRWTPETAETATWPKATAGYNRTWLISNRYVEDGSYLKLKYITLAYDWIKPCKYIEKIGFNFTVNNVFTLTKYSWYEPDVNSGGTNAATQGVDSYSYPSYRSFNLGINFVF